MAMGDISVAFCADDAYAMPTGVAALSLARNLDPDRSAEIFVIDGGISPENRSKIHQALSGFPNVRLRWLDFDREKIAHLHGNIHLSRSAYLRIFLPEILPAGLSRVLYLDSDMVITGDVEQADRHSGDNGLLDLCDRLQQTPVSGISVCRLQGQDVQRHRIIGPVLELYSDRR